MLIIALEMSTTSRPSLIITLFESEHHIQKPKFRFFIIVLQVSITFLNLNIVTFHEALIVFLPHSARDAAGEAAAVLRYPGCAALGGPGDGQGGAQEAPRRDGTQVERGGV